MILIRLALICVLMLGAVGGANAAPYHALSEPEKLKALGQLILNDRFDQAEKLLDATKFSPPAAPLAIMLRARIAVARGDQRGAIRILRHGTKTYPENRNLRSALAAILAKAGHTNAAEQQLRVLIDTAPSADQRTEFEARLRRLDTGRPWRGSVFLSMVQDSNVNAGPSAQDVILFGLPFVIDPATQATSGTGLRFGANLSFTRELGSQWWGYAATRLTVEDFAGSIFDTQAVGLTFGLRKALTNALYGAEAIVEANARDFRMTDSALGGRLYGSWRMPQGYIISASTRYLERDNRASKALFRSELFSQISITQRFSTRESLSFGLFHEHFDVRANPITSYNTFGLNLSYARPLGAKIDGRIDLRAYQKSFDGVFIGKSEPRGDVNMSLTLGLDFRHVDVFGLSPRLNVTFERNRSNVEIYDFSRKSVGLTLVRSF